MFYSAVLLDGKELHCLTLAEVRDLYCNRQINSESLICDAETGQWRMLKRSFNLDEWMPAAAHIDYQPGINPFQTPSDQFVTPEPPAASNSFDAAPVDFQPPLPISTGAAPVTFNQFPPNDPPSGDKYYKQLDSNGYSQNNQTETYYQAHITHSNYNFQNNQTNFAPSKYGNPADSYQPPPDNVGSAPPLAIAAGPRRGARHAAVFLLVNAFIFVVFTIFEALFSNPGENQSNGLRTGIGTSIIPFIIDLVLAAALWKKENLDTARKWVLVRSYLGFLVFGIVFPVLSINAGDIFAGAFSLVSMFFYFFSLAIVLHGSESPAPSRVMIGTGMFAVYFVIMFGAIALTLAGNILPSIAKIESLNKKQFDKYRVEGKEFQDKTTGAKVILPEGWSMISLDNPIIHTPEARMIAIDRLGNRLTMLEVVPVPGNLDMKRQNSSLILDQISDGVVQSLKDQVRENGGFGQNSFREITRLSIYIGKHPAKLLVFDKTENGVNAKGHLIITYDELTFYVLHSWCPAEEYETAQNDFRFFEQNFSVPEKINSTFTQTAETLKK